MGIVEFHRSRKIHWYKLQSSMSEEGKSRGIAADFPNQPYYGTFQGVANYYPPAPPPQQHHPQPQTVVCFPQPIPPPGTYVGPQSYHHGYQTLPVTGWDFLLVMVLDFTVQIVGLSYRLELFIGLIDACVINHGWAGGECSYWIWQFRFDPCGFVRGCLKFLS